MRYLNVLILLASVIAATATQAQGQDRSTAPLKGSWSITGRMHTYRTGDTMTLLRSGRVLVVGGDAGSGAVATTELYDPRTRRWFTTGSLHTARQHHGATLLYNGDLIVTGGEDKAKNRVASAELYDPRKGQWSPTASMTTPREQHIAILLRNGKVLVAGGLYTSTAELYDPRSGTWARTGTMHTDNPGDMAVLLPSGMVLVAGGSLAEEELYEPATGRWLRAGRMITRRDYGTMTVLRDGRVLVTGGEDASSRTIATAELFNPRTNRWSLTTRMHTARESHTATLLRNGDVLVAGGIGAEVGGGLHPYLSSAEIYSPRTGRWTGAGHMAKARSDHTATLLNSGQVLVAGGLGEGGSTAELYTPGSRSITMSRSKYVVHQTGRTPSHSAVSHAPCAYTVNQRTVCVSTGFATMRRPETWSGLRLSRGTY